MVVTLNFQPEIGSYDDVTVCDLYVLPSYEGDLSPNVGYFDGPGGSGTMYDVGDTLFSSQTIYVYDETADGCTDETSFDVTINTVELTASVDNHESCEAACDGQATATASSGATPYSFEWSDGQTGETASDLCAGTFTVTVTDDNGCQATASVTIDAGPVETVPVFDIDTLVCLTDDPIDLPTTSDNDVTGSWSGSGVSGNSFDPADAGVGSHTVTFTPDAGQCASSTT